MHCLTDVLSALELRCIPARLYKAFRVRLAMFHAQPQAFQVRAWLRLLEQYREWDDTEFMLPGWALHELRMQEDLSGSARQSLG